MPDQLAIISGGTRGLGGELARRCLLAGYRVATFSRSKTSLVEELFTQYGDGGQCGDGRSAPSFYWESVDATDAPALQQFVSGAVERFGPVSVLINNAGTGRFGLFATAPLKDINESLQTNVAGSLLLTRLCTAHMLAVGQGCVVNISSVNALRGHSGVAIYSATKAAIDGFTRALARELGPRNIRVNSVAPGYFESEMTAGLSEHQLSRLVRGTPLGRLGRTQEIADAVMFLVSEQASFITGQTLVVDGGVTC